jgi:hypothetical protein
MSFNSGNTTNINMPATVSALKVSGYEAGTKEGEVVSLEPPKDILSAKGGKTNETGKAKSSAAAPGKTHS